MEIDIKIDEHNQTRAGPPLPHLHNISLEHAQSHGDVQPEFPRAPQLCHFVPALGELGEDRLDARVRAGRVTVAGDALRPGRRRRGKSATRRGVCTARGEAE